MTTQEYQAMVLETCGATSEFDRLLAGGLGLAGETGEVIDHIKKAVFHQHPMNHKEMSKELGDTLWYLTLIAQTCGFSLDDIMEGNATKLRKRYPNGFDFERSLNREEYK